MPSPPLPVRLADMEEAERAYQAADPEERVRLHARLTFYRLLEIGERAALERRFPNELSDDPEAPGVAASVKVSWDFRSRELVIALLAFGATVLEAKAMDLVGRIYPSDDVAILALTVTGSVIALTRPDAAGVRRYTYKPSARPERGARRGRAKLKAIVKLGNRVDLAPLRTSELMVLAAGPALPEADAAEARAGSGIFSPVEDTAPGKGLADQVRVNMVRYRVLVDAAGNAPEATRGETQRWVARVARELQVAISGGERGGRALDQVSEFRTSSGSRYEVSIEGERVDLKRYARADADAPTDPNLDPAGHLADASIGDQRLVVGAPLVINHIDRPGLRAVSCIFKLTEVTPR